jgi:hypothetical protein
MKELKVWTLFPSGDPVIFDRERAWYFFVLHILQAAQRVDNGTWAGIEAIR